MTQDESLWPQIGPGLDRDWALKQVDTVDELIRVTRTGQPGVIVWDAREPADREGDLSRMQLHCSRFPVVVLDADTGTERWKAANQQRQIAALVGIPFDTGQLIDAFSSAREECLTRGIVLGESGPAALDASAPPPDRGRQLPWFKLGLAAAVCLAGGVVFLLHRNSAPRAPIPPAASPALTGPAQPADARAAAEEQVDALLDKARQAMLDRHFVEPADGNALALYRNVLKYDPNNGEAREALQRLAQVLVARVQSDLDAKKIDTATQALEAARSISPDDPRLAELDAHIETLRAEIGTAQIQAAINAGNLDRALQLLDGAERTKSLSGAKVSQLREQILRLQAQASSADPQAPAQASSKKVQHDLDAERDAQARQAKILAHTLELAQARLAQGKILEPDGDNALYYVNQVRASDPTLGGLAQTSNAIRSAILAQARTALDSQDTGKAELLLGAARGLGSSADIDALYDAFAQQKQKQSRAAAVAAAANSLVPLKPLKLDYPRAALESGTEGWVDVAFDVTPDGKVANITVVDASPRNVFDSAAKSALSRARFQPALVDGQAVVIRATRHIVFRMSKE